tara:strand:+ start:9797 stop:10723 length:927 start_codon:yes stop_codon:yes gene_type:complete
MTSAGYILNPDFFMVPSYRISPFSTRDIKFNFCIPKCNIDIESKIKEKHGSDWYIKVTEGARSAIHIALTELSLELNDQVTILTPTNNDYVSGCVTKEIEKICKWNRIVNSQTKAIFIIHEFGKLFENIKEIKEYGLPIIEDYAHSFDSYDKTSVKGDYLIYSLPKFFPIQYGGLLLSKKEIESKHDLLMENVKSYLSSALSYYWDEINNFSILRKNNYKILTELFSRNGFTPRFYYNENETPSVFMFKNSQSNPVNFKLLKEYMQKLGVESSIFYGEDSFFIPVNHTLDYVDLHYIYDIFLNFRGEK